MVGLGGIRFGGGRAVLVVLLKRPAAFEDKLVDKDEGDEKDSEKKGANACCLREGHPPPKLRLGDETIAAS